MCAIVEFLRSNSQQRILGLAARNKLITYILITRAKAMQSTGEEEEKNFNRLVYFLRCASTDYQPPSS